MLLLDDLREVDAPLEKRELRRVLALALFDDALLVLLDRDGGLQQRLDLRLLALTISHAEWQYLQTRLLDFQPLLMDAFLDLDEVFILLDGQAWEAHLLRDFALGRRSLRGLSRLLLYSLNTLLGSRHDPLRLPRSLGSLQRLRVTAQLTALALRHQVLLPVAIGLAAQLRRSLRRAVVRSQVDRAQLALEQAKGLGRVGHAQELAIQRVEDNV